MGNESANSKVQRFGITRSRSRWTREHCYAQCLAFSLHQGCRRVKPSPANEVPAMTVGQLVKLVRSQTLHRVFVQQSNAS